MQNLVKAHNQLFSRRPDERFSSLSELWEHCHREKQESQTRWYSPMDVCIEPTNGSLRMVANDEPFGLNDWVFGQVCKLAEVSKETVSRLSSKTASLVLGETLPRGNKPLQVFTLGDQIRSVHGVSYTRLYNVDLLSLVLEFVTDFEAAQEAMGGGTGLYCGEQDMFCFLIDPTGWTEIDGQFFAPGFFLWNSEVGRRTVGVQTFWFQKVCQNHIVWDAVDIVEFTRKHTTNVHEALDSIREILVTLTKRRDERQDGFVRVITKAMKEVLGHDEDEVIPILQAQGINRAIAKEALSIAKGQGEFTIYSVVDALTRLSQRNVFAGERAQIDYRASRLLTLVA
ncbi:MAG: hypothetical protein AMXMBFR84_50150 [Candidatus Hydrogenedentota bacterium]